MRKHIISLLGRTSLCLVCLAFGDGGIFVSFIFFARDWPLKVQTVYYFFCCIWFHFISHITAIHVNSSVIYPQTMTRWIICIKVENWLIFTAKVVAINAGRAVGSETKWVYEKCVRCRLNCYSCPLHRLHLIHRPIEIKCLTAQSDGFGKNS